MSISSTDTITPVCTNCGAVDVPQSTSGSVPASATQWSDTVVATLVALFMLIAAAVAPVSEGARRSKFSALWGTRSRLRSLISTHRRCRRKPPSGSRQSPRYSSFISWAGERSFKAGWVAVIAVVLIVYFSSKVSPVFGSGAANFELLYGSYLATGLTFILLLGNGFDGPKPGGRRVNPFARAAMIMLLSSFMLNCTAGSLMGFGGSTPALVLVILLVVLAIIFGHVGFVQAGRRHERGRGLALTTLILGYLVAIADIILVRTLASLLGAFGGGIY